MTWFEVILYTLLLTASSLAVAAHRRCLTRRRKPKVLQRLYDHTEQPLST